MDYLIGIYANLKDSKRILSKEESHLTYLTTLPRTTATGKMVAAAARTKMLRRCVVLYQRYLVSSE